MAITAELVVVGSVNQDTTLWVERFPDEGETTLAHTTSGALGGKGANQALAAARAGASVALIAAVGDDSAGRLALEYLQAHGVDVSLCVTVAGARTGIAHILVDATGANQIVVAPNANILLDPRHVASAFARVRGARVVIAQQEVSPSVVQTALNGARKAAVSSILNASPTLPPGVTIPAPDLLVVNRSEAQQLTGLIDRPAEDLAAALVVQAAGSSAIVTDGARGAAASDGQTTWRENPAAVEVIDTTGAGDAFAGTLAAALAQNGDLRQALTIATLAGARAVTQRGAQAHDAAPSATQPERVGLSTIDHNVQS